MAFILTKNKNQSIIHVRLEETSAPVDNPGPFSPQLPTCCSQLKESKRKVWGKKKSILVKVTFSYLHSLKRAGKAVFFTPVDNPKHPIGSTINIFTEKISGSTNELVLRGITLKNPPQSRSNVRRFDFNRQLLTVGVEVPALRHQLDFKTGQHWKNVSFFAESAYMWRIQKV